MHPVLELKVPLGIGLFLVLTIIASLSASTTCPKHYVDMATAYVANINESELNKPTPARGAWKKNIVYAPNTFRRDSLNLVSSIRSSYNFFLLFLSKSKSGVAGVWLKGFTIYKLCFLLFDVENYLYDLS